MQEPLRELRDSVRYGGNPEHKRNPGDFGLSPPSAAGHRPAKSLCDDVKVFRRQDALCLLRRGLELGLVSDRFEDGWPKNVWMVTDGGVPLEAQWEAKGSYHGYPMPEDDAFRDEVLKAWKRRHG